MKSSLMICLVASSLMLASTIAQAGVAYPNPAGGWNYIYQGDQVNTGDTTALDGSWRHNNGSDEWNRDGIYPGDGTPGGVDTFTDGGVSYISIVDAVTIGSGSLNNRKIFFVRNTTDAGVTNSGQILDNGITLTFRTRLTPPTSPAIGDLPTLPDGYGIFSDGKGGFGIHIGSGSSTDPHQMISFSLVRTNEDTSPTGTNRYNALGKPGGLTMNRLNGNGPSGNSAVNTSGTASNNQLVPLDNLTDWHEFWIVLQDNGPAPGTHRALIFVDGTNRPVSFNVTSGSGNEGSGSYLSMGCNNSTTIGAFDVDFYGYKQGVWVPPGAEPYLPPSFTRLTPAADSMFNNPASGFSFGITSFSPLDSASVRVTINGGDASRDLAITGSSTNLTVTYSKALASNFVYTIGMSVSNLYQSASAAYSFDTFSSDTFTIEAEDYNYCNYTGYNGVQGYLPDPWTKYYGLTDFPNLVGGLSKNSAPPSGWFTEDETGDSYFVSGNIVLVGLGGFPDNRPSSLASGYSDLVSKPGVDYSKPDESWGGYGGSFYENDYRICDGVNTHVSLDGLRARYLQNLVITNEWGSVSTNYVRDYEVWMMCTNQWMNYTRFYPSNSYNVYLRHAASASQTVRLDSVSSPAVPTQTTNVIGAFAVTSTGGTDLYRYVRLTMSGTNVVLNRNGTSTVRLFTPTANTNLNLNFIAFVPPQPALSPVSVKLTRSGTDAMLTFPTQKTWNYTVEYKNTITNAWAPLSLTLAGTGEIFTITNTGATVSTRFYRVRVN